MSLPDANLAVLAKRHPQVFRALEETPRKDGLVTVVPTPSGAPTALLGGISMHSRYDPLREAAAQVEKEIDESATACIVIGFGLGYAAEAFRDRFPSVPLLVVEPEVEMFRAALSTRLITRLLSDGKSSFLVGGRPEEVVALLESLPLEKPVFLRLRPAVERNRPWCLAAEEIVRSFLLRREININTLERFGRLWVRNLSRNMRAFLESPGVSRLAGLFEGLPALVIAGGPSLDAVAPRLGELSERLLLVAVNTPLKPCLEAGVAPDFTVVVDPQYWASRYLDWAGKGEGVVVAEPSTHPRVFRRPGALFFLCSSLFPLGERLEAAVGVKGKLGAGGSVATSAWDFARLLGANPIYTAGLDLGFPGMRTHCRGVFPEDAWFTAAFRVAPVEGNAFRSLREIGIFPVRSASGGVTYTDRRMLLYKWWFESQLATHPGVKSLTLSPDSAEIRGMPLAEMEQLLSLPPVRDEIDARMRSARERGQCRQERPGGKRRQERPEGMRGGPARRGTQQTAARGAREALRSALEELGEGLEELERISSRAIALTAELRNAFARGGDPEPSLCALDGIDRRILEISDRTIVGFLIQPLIHRIAGMGERKDTPEEVIARSVEMYSGIRESARYQRELLSRAAEGIS